MRQNSIYLSLLALIAFGVFVDWYVWQDNPPPYTLNDFVQMVGIIALCWLWQGADAKRLNTSQSRATKVLTILLPPIGNAVYFFQSRNWKPALFGFLLFWGGVVLIAVLAVTVTDFAS